MIDQIIQAIEESSIDFTDATIHCSAGRPDANETVESIRIGHKKRNFSDIGYHLVITRDGEWHFGRTFGKQGAHVRGHNSRNVGICLCGGVDAKGRPENNFTEAQMATLRDVVSAVSVGGRIPLARFKGHRDWFPDINGDGIIDHRDWLKACPTFSVSEFLASMLD